MPSHTLLRKSSASLSRSQAPRQRSSDKSTLKSPQNGRNNSLLASVRPKRLMSDPSSNNTIAGSSCTETTIPHNTSASSLPHQKTSNLKASSGEDLTKSVNQNCPNPSTSTAEIERLRVAMNAKLQLKQRRRKLDRQSTERKTRAKEEPLLSSCGRRRSLHLEEMSPPTWQEICPSVNSFNLDTLYTEPGPHIQQEGVPSVKIPANQSSFPYHTPRTNGYTNFGNRLYATPKDHPDLFTIGPLDSLMSGTVTPSSALFLQSAGSNDVEEDSRYATPDIYELSLMLGSEPGLEAWWTTVIEVMKNSYGAQRVTLSVPADSTDIENVPWGQKATFSEANLVGIGKKSVPEIRHTPKVVANNKLSTRASEEKSSKCDAQSVMPKPTISRPHLPNRHSFTAYEDSKYELNQPPPTRKATLPAPNAMPRNKYQINHRADAPPRTGTLQNAQINLQTFKDQFEFDPPQSPEEWDGIEQSSRELTGCMFPVLQALDFEADPLIDNKGVLRVLQRGKVIALTRDYPYVDSSKSEERNAGTSWHCSTSKASVCEKLKTRTTETGTRFSSLHSHRPSKRSMGSVLNTQACDKGQEQNYDEYEQPPASPWSQSPAPSPAVHVETSENMFFSNTQAVDEESFNPQQTPPDYAEGPQPEIIGADRSSTVLHIPLFHPLLSKPVQSFRLDASALKSRFSGHVKDRASNESTSESISPSHEKKPRRTPIAILSILTPIIPYPSKLRDSLKLLAPHLATTFSLCRHYSNLETEMAGLARKRPSTVGFGAVVPGTMLRSVEDSYLLDSTQRSTMDDMAQQRSLGGSLTSPSDYSGLSRSNAGSLVGTPVCDSGSNGLQDKRLVSESPSYAGVEGYFSQRARPILSKVDFGPSVKTRNVSKELSPVGARMQMEIYDTDDHLSDQDNKLDNEEQKFGERPLMEANASSDVDPRQGISKEMLSYTPVMDTSSFGHVPTEPIPPKSYTTRSVLHHACSRTDRPSVSHTLLHSYGADFGATFQPLPSTTRNRATKVKTHNRSTSIPELTPSGYMPPPSDRVKGILLDSLPLHLFIALPPTGEIVWVNSRYLTYRGQTVDNLYENPWGSIHPEERKEYLKSWKHALRTGEQFAMQARLRRFDGTYRWFYTRASGLRDGRGVVVQWHGTSMDIHEQHVAEVKAARQEEIEASEAKHRRLANLIPQIIFSATEDDGVTFANQQWLSYTGQSLEGSVGFGFMDFVHPDDIAKCQILIKEPNDSHEMGQKKLANKTRLLSPMSSDDKSSCDFTEEITGSTSLSRTSSSSSSSSQESHLSDISGLTQSSAIKVDKDSNGQVFYSTEVRFRSKTGEYRWHLVRCVEVENINLGTGDGSWFGACADINDHKLLEMKLKEAMESKSKFLSNMSHEIRTPLIGISGMISFLQDTVLNEEQMDYCNTISSSAQGLLAIINDILDLAKADAGMMKLAFDWFHVRSLVEEVNETLSTMAITKHLEVNYVVDVDVPEMVKGDRFRIRQALLNVIGNAIKFTSVGEVFTRCKMVSNKDRSQQLAEHEVMLEFSITDTGKGFTQEEAEIIFKPFSQIDSSSTRTQGGTGLGLVISRQLIELHGGKMEGTAVPGKGSTFTFTSVFGLPTLVDYPESPTTPAIDNLPCVKNSGNYIALRGAINSSKTSSLVSSTQADSGANFGARSNSPMGSKSNLSTPYASSGYSIKTVTEATPKSKSLATEPNKSFPPKVKISIPANHSTIQPSMTPPKIIPSLPKLPQTLESYPNSEIVTKHTCQRMYSILLICPQKYSREATTQHIEMTLSKNVPHKIKALPSVEDAHLLISGEGPIHFTHIVLNLGTADEVVHLIDQILKKSGSQISIVILSDPLQRQEVMKKSNYHDYTKLSQENRITFIFKPVKPSRFAVIFDPDKERDLSTDRNRFSAQQRVATQRQSYLDIGKRLGNKGLRVLLVEDNATNQKVLLKYLGKVGIAVDLALDGLECTEKVFSKPRSYYSLVLCDLHMPNKDGYQACREIREWEKKQNYNPMPIIALSANVMTDVIDRCNKAGFSNYITKPVDFKVLSTIMGDCLDPEGSQTAVAEGENKVLRHLSSTAG